MGAHSADRPLEAPTERKRRWSRPRVPWIGFTIQHSPRRSRLCSAALNFVERSTQVERPFASAEGFGSLVASWLWLW